jgi:hypothetical protein
MSFEFTQDDVRAGQRAMLMKLADKVSTMKSGGKVDVSGVEELDTDSKLTVKEVAEAFNQLVKALKA